MQQVKGSVRELGLPLVLQDDPNNDQFGCYQYYHGRGDGYSYDTIAVKCGNGDIHSGFSVVDHLHVVFSTNGRATCRAYDLHYWLTTLCVSVCMCACVYVCVYMRRGE